MGVYNMMRSAFVAAFGAALLLACRDTPTSPTTSGCSSFAGVYTVSYEGSCTKQYLHEWTLVQSGCDVHMPILPDYPTVNGWARGNTLHLTMRNGFTRCEYQLEGDAILSGRILRGTVSGSTSGPCCGDG